jgi:hypothetical protein
VKAGKTGKVARVAKAGKIGGKAADLTAVFYKLQGMLAVHVPPFKATDGMVRDKRNYNLTVPVPVVLSPKAYGGKPYPVAMASLVLQKGYVGFYCMPVYMEPGMKKKLAPELVKLLKGKSCFYVKALTPEVREGIRAALELGVMCFRERGWV